MTPDTAVCAFSKYLGRSFLHQALSETLTKSDTGPPDKEHAEQETNTKGGVMSLGRGESYNVPESKG